MTVHLKEHRPGTELEIFARKVAIVAAVMIILAFLWLVRDILVLFFIAAVLAAGISPAVRRVRVLWRYWFHRNLPRGPAVMIVYLPFLVFVVALSTLLVPRFISDWQQLSAQLPVLIELNVLQPLERYFPMDALRNMLERGIEIPQASVFVYVRSAATAVAAGFAILFMIAYMLIDAPRLRNLILLVYPADVRGDRLRTLNRMGRRMSSWLMGQLLLAGIIGGATYVGLMLLGIPYALPLAILAGVGEVFPIIGPILSSLPALAVAILHSPWQFWAVLAFYFLLQKFENYIIVPRVMSKKVSVSPLTVFVAFMMGASVLGIVGAVVAIPVAAIVQVAFEEAFVARRERRQDLDRAGTLLRRVD
ncbi:MAG TPA: AI-2E family transporter [Thermoanaerobaculia bacterium]|nr:AI-2E family transporter [Thermoanaerobaculia bacterium]